MSVINEITIFLVQIKDHIDHSEDTICLSAIYFSMKNQEQSFFFGFTKDTTSTTITKIKYIASCLTKTYTST